MHPTIVEYEEQNQTECVNVNLFNVFFFQLKIDQMFVLEKKQVLDQKSRKVPLIYLCVFKQ